MSKTFDNSQMINGNQALLDAIKEIDDNDSGINATTVNGTTKELLGIGGDVYTWVDETDNRALDTTYTNTYGHPILIFATIRGDADNRLGFYVYIDDILMSYVLSENALSDASDARTITFIVPNSSTYNITNVKDSSIDYWFELK